MSDSIKKYEENYFYYEDSWNQKNKEKLIFPNNNNLTKSQALNIINSLYLYYKDSEELLEEITELKNYIKNV